MSPPDPSKEPLESLVRQALALADAQCRWDTAIALNEALITLDGIGDAGPADYPPAAAEGSPDA